MKTRNESKFLDNEAVLFEELTSAVRPSYRSYGYQNGEDLYQDSLIVLLEKFRAGDYADREQEGVKASFLKTRQNHVFNANRKVNKVGYLESGLVPDKGSEDQGFEDVEFELMCEKIRKSLSPADVALFDKLLLRQGRRYPKGSPLALTSSERVRKGRFERKFAKIFGETKDFAV